MFICLPIDSITPTKDNPRTVNTKSDGFKELVGSIKANGILVPVHVRNKGGKGKATHELLDGERRFCAAVAAQLKEIPAIDHGEMTDEEAFEITFTTNFAREDLTPLEQGKAVATLLEKYKDDTKAVASKLGKSIRWVLERAHIHKNLTKAWKEAIAEESNFREWTTAHLQKIAGFPAKVQDEILEWANDQTGHFYGDEVVTVKELEKELADWLKLLRLAPWDMDDKFLIKNDPTCEKCKNRSSAQPGLFDDVLDDDQIKKNDRCLWPGCWDRKYAAWLEKTVKGQKHEHPSVVCVTSDKRYDSDVEAAANKAGARVVDKYKISKQGARGAMPAVMMNGPDIGKLKWITETKRSSSQSSGSSSAASPGKPTPLKERRKMLASKRWNEVLKQLQGLIRKSTPDMITCEDRVVFIVNMAAVFGVDSVLPDCLNKFGHYAEWPVFDKSLSAALKPKCFTEQLTIVGASLWQRITPVLRNQIAYSGPITQVPDSKIKNAKIIAGHLGINIDAMFVEQVKAIPEPKSWANLKADGTPKAKKATTKKKTAKKKVAKKTTAKKATGK